MHIYVSILPKSKNYISKFIIPRLYALNTYAKHLSVVGNIKYVDMFWSYIHLDPYKYKHVRSELFSDGLHLSKRGVAVACKMLKSLIHN